MRIPKFVLTLFLVGTSAIFAQEKQVTLEDIWSGTFSQERLESLKSLNNGTEYIVLNQDRQARSSSIDAVSYKHSKLPTICSV